MTTEIPFPFIDPVLIDLPGRFDVRWYGLCYVIGFYIAYRILTRLSRTNRFPFGVEEVGNLLTWLILGVVGGGRIGYALFYSPKIKEDPLSIIRLWEGGLSFHGGLLGVAAVGVIFAVKYRKSLWAIADGLALAVTPGIFLVRMANFIKGELYGRVVESGAWYGMRFPSDPAALKALEIQRLPIREQELAMLAAKDNGTWDAVKEQVPMRHPSQLYEAFGEGILLGIVLFVLSRMFIKRKVQLGNGFLFGIFLSGYGLYRFLIENFREPDAQFREGGKDGFVLWNMTMGQVLCSVMILAGLVLCARAFRNRDESSQPGSALFTGTVAEKT